MEHITIDITALKDTGFSSWMAFSCSVHTTSLSQWPITYGYEHPQKGKGTITLPISPRMLHALAMEDGKSKLRKIGASSFTALMNDFQDERCDRNGCCQRDVVVKSVTGEIRYERLVFNIEDVYKMANLEKTVGDYLVYEEEGKEGSQ